MPQVGQPGVVLQPLAITNNAVRRTVRKILDLIEIPSCDFPFGTSLRPAPAFIKPVNHSIRNLHASGLEPELQLLQNYVIVLRHSAYRAGIL